MMVDTDVLIWYLRGNEHARRVIDALGAFAISAVTYMEIVQGVRNAAELRTLKRFLLVRQVAILPLDAGTTTRAIAFMEAYALSHGLRLADALIAATADARGDTLLTANTAHYRMISSLEIKSFRPGSAGGARSAAG
jgi:hypothetical protein